MTGKKLIHGYLDKLGRNIQALDASIESVRKPAKGEKPTDRRARLKLLRDLVELQNASMAAVKVHLLGRDESGASNEPSDCWDGNDETEYERLFRDQLKPWTLDRLRLKCSDCGVESEDTSTRDFPDSYEADRYFDLCAKCYEKRVEKRAKASEEETQH